MTKLLTNYNEDGFTVNVSFVYDNKDIDISFSIKNKNDLVEHLSASYTSSGEISNDLFESIEYRDMLIAINNVIKYTTKELEKIKETL